MSTPTASRRATRATIVLFALISCIGPESASSSEVYASETSLYRYCPRLHPVDRSGVNPVNFVL